MRDIPALDGMRGVAATLVVGFHVVVFAMGLRPDGFDPAPQETLIARLWLNWGFIGVDFFFVLSAFLLSQPLLAPRGPFDARAYASKRLLRIVPAYYASLVVGWLLVGRTGHPWFAVDWHQLWTHATFLHGLWADTVLNVSPVYWTLAVELQFYLLLPLLVIPFRGRHWPWALAATLAVTLAYRAWVATGDGVPEIRLREAQLPAFLWHFGLGIAMARVRHAVRRRRPEGRLVDLGILLAVLGFLVAPTAAILSRDTIFGFVDLGPLVFYRPWVAVGFAAIILLACSGPGRTAALLTSPPLLMLGRWSYSLYLVHYPLGAWLVLQRPDLLDLGLGQLAFALTVAGILAAAAFHAAVEAPALRLKDRWVGWASRRGRPEPEPAPQP